MNKAESKYFNTAVRMDQAFLRLLDEKEYAYITVKEICAAAQVNRSTFYLHYESINDLLMEAMAYVSAHFSSYFAHLPMQPELIQCAPNADLIFITPEFLTPWLTFVKENKRLYQTILKRMNTIPMEEKLAETIYQALHQILDRFGVPQENQNYMMLFYLEGMNGIVKEWLRQDCQRSIDDVIGIILECVRPK